MNHFPSRAALLWLCVLGAPVSGVFAQNLVAPSQNTASIAERLGAEVRDKIVEGRALLENEDPRSVTVLREAAQGSLRVLSGALGRDALQIEGTPEDRVSDDVISSALLQRAAEAHYYYGLAAQNFNRRDEAIAAFSRAQRFVNINGKTLSELTSDDERLAQNINTALGALMRAGLPLVAPDDVIRGLSRFNSRGIWKPREIGFSPRALEAEIGGKPLENRQFFVTSGQIFVPQRPNAPLFVVPPYYRQTALESLPLSLQTNQMVAGYARELSGPNAGQWRQIVRVFYASPRLTTGKRDDGPRAEKLAQQFLKIHSLFQTKLGANNLYTRGERDENVTTLWLLEVSALWPNDDEDHAILAQLGPTMPRPNTGTIAPATEPQTTPLMKPWTPISGQAEGSPGEIMFWKSGMERPEAEWLAEITHEYGHVALPPIGGFRPPLEPYGNGVMGETLGMVWIAAIEREFALENPSQSDLDSPFLTKSVASHLENYAIPARETFLELGPQWTGRNNGSAQALRFLAGLGVYLERVYGAKQLGRALNPLAQRGVAAPNVMARRQLLNTSSLLEAIPPIYNTGWNGKTMNIWLPGALSARGVVSAPTLVNRSEITMRAAQSSEATLFVPRDAVSLRIEGVNAGQLRSVGLPSQGSGNVCRITFGPNKGWQKFSLTAGATLKISNARFER